VRRVLAALAATGALIAAGAGQTEAQASPLTEVHGALARGIRAAGSHSGAFVLDMTTGRTLFSSAASTGRVPASVEKLYTTSTALLRFGSAGTFTTSVVGVGAFDSAHGWHGTLYLKGGGDPTFGAQSFDRAAYGTGATMEALVANLKLQTGITSVTGTIVGDESYFDSLRGTAPFGFHASSEIEGMLSGLAYDRGYTGAEGSAFQAHPALFAAQRLAASLKAAGVRVMRGTRIRVGRTPATPQALAEVKSPRMATVIRLTNTPSDNYLAEMLLKGLGAAFGGTGSSASGVGVVRTQLASFGIRPQFNDGSGLSRADSTSPRQVVTLLQKMSTNTDFLNSLAIAGETGTLSGEMRGTAAQGRCRGKTGTLHDVASLAGFCAAQDGHTLAFAFLMNGLSDPNRGHALEANMAVALAKYSG
jgi:D-alanyl-D-alanine carboxypeptidase/D-alanyl-D-alanine-endopeptidase (penicillin-binding protein 4)